MSTPTEQTKSAIDDIQWQHPNAIVECAWLKDQIGNTSLRIYDCTTYLHYTDDHPSKPYDVVSGLAEYSKAHISNSAYLELQKDLSDADSPYSFTLPNLSQLADCFKQQGIGDPYHIILYSRNGMQWATRIWWMIYVLGYKNVSVLNGGFAEWQRLGLPTEQTSTCFPAADFKPEEKPEVFVGKEEVLASINDTTTVLLNALTADIHAGRNNRYGRPGHIINSINIPFHLLVDSESGKFMSPENALQIFKKHNITPDHNIINYCGGGIAATLDAFVLSQLGFQKLFIYDNSLSEWAMDPDLPMETGQYFTGPVLSPRRPEDKFYEKLGKIMPKAIVLREYGSPNVLQVEDVTVANPELGEILIRQTAIGVNFHDVYVRSGLYKTLSLPGIPGLEATGVVEAVGPGPSAFKIGDRIAYITSGYGAYASHRILQEKLAVKLPDYISDTLVATNFTRLLTVEMLTKKVTQLQAGQTILVTAATGGGRPVAVPTSPCDGRARNRIGEHS